MRVVCLHNVSILFQRLLHSLRPTCHCSALLMSPTGESKYVSDLTAADIPISLQLYSCETCKAKGAKFSFDSSVFSSLEILSCALLDPVSKTTARGSFSWSKEKALARLKRRDFRGMQGSSPGLRPGGDDVTTSAKRRLGVERPRGSPRRASSCQGNVPSSRQGRCRDK